MVGETHIQPLEVGSQFVLVVRRDIDLALLVGGGAVAGGEGAVVVGDPDGTSVGEGRWRSGGRGRSGGILCRGEIPASHEQGGKGKDRDRD